MCNYKLTTSVRLYRSQGQAFAVPVCLSRGFGLDLPVSLGSRPTENFTDIIYEAHYKRTNSRRYFLYFFSEVVKSHRLRFFGYLARTAPAEDHHRNIVAALRPPADRKRRAEYPRTTCLRTVDEDVQPQNFGVHLPGGRPRIRKATF